MFLPEIVNLYLVTNKVNGKRYIGQTKNSIGRRFKSHVSNALSSSHDGNMIISKAIRKYGPSNFRIELLAQVDMLEADNAETQLISDLKPEYNILPGGSLSNKSIECPYCKVMTQYTTFKLYHGDNCAYKGAEEGKKICRKCGEQHVLSMYFSATSNHDGLSGTCKFCLGHFKPKSICPHCDTKVHGKAVHSHFDSCMFKDKVDGHARCKDCTKLKPTSEFYACVDGSINSVCKVCSMLRSGLKNPGKSNMLCDHCGKTVSNISYTAHHGDKCVYKGCKDGHKRCSSCDRELQLSNFYRTSGNQCKDCVAIQKYHIVKALDHPIPFVRVLADLYSKGAKCSPRGLRIKELRDYKIVVDYPFASVKDRNLPINYIRKEWQWYLHSDKYDTRIKDHAPMWATIMQPDGSIASNYGQYMFGDQNGFQWVIDCLRKDPDSRQAIIPFAHKDNLYDGNKDQICTLGIIFSIRDNLLNMTVEMRSNDIFRGATADWVMFTWLWEMIALELGVARGEYTHIANSMHVYEENYDTMIKILKNPNSYAVEIPSITNTKDLISGKFETEFGKWLTEVKL
jgi:thymidylate synthase